MYTNRLENDKPILTETLAKILIKKSFIRNRKNERAVVIMSLEDYNAIEETADLLRSPANAANLWS